MLSEELFEEKIIKERIAYDLENLEKGIKERGFYLSHIHHPLPSIDNLEIYVIDLFEEYQYHIYAETLELSDNETNNILFTLHDSINKNSKILGKYKREKMDEDKTFTLVCKKSDYEYLLFPIWLYYTKAKIVENKPFYTLWNNYVVKTVVENGYFTIGKKKYKWEDYNLFVLPS